MISVMLLGWAALCSAAISPGPNMFAVAARALGAGRTAALMVALGIGLGAFIWSMLATLGMSIILKTYPIIIVILGLVGGSYLLWLGYKGFRSAITGGTSTIAAQQSFGLDRDFLHGLIVTLSNPKVAMLWASIAIYIEPITNSLTMLLIFCSVSALLMFFIYGIYALIFAAHNMRRLHQQFQRTSNAIFGFIFVILGASLFYRIVPILTGQT